MKRLLVFFFILCATFVIINFTLPVDNSFSKKIYIRTTVNAVNRFLFDETNWAKWWPSRLQGGLSINSNKEGNDNYLFTLRKQMYGGINIDIKKNNSEFNTVANLLRVSKDSISLTWDFYMQRTNHPYFKFRNYFYSKAIKKDAVEILESLKSFLEKNENIYGIKITQMKVKDTILISTKHISSSYPSTLTIYSLINLLRKYISKEGAKETNPPMLNITNDSSTYRTMVAIPVNKIFSEKDNYVFKRMVPGKILVTEVKGGDYTARQALKQLDLYIDDNHLFSPAIPFESLITDRSLEPDTTKWVTKIYYPIY